MENLLSHLRQQGSTHLVTSQWPECWCRVDASHVMETRSNPRYRWVTFDCFGTLIDWHTGFSRILSPILGGQVTQVLSGYHRFERALEASRPHRLYKDVLAQGLQKAAAELGVPLSERETTALPRSWATLPIFPDVEDMLAHLRRLGFRLGVLTNCDEDLFEQTHRSFLQRFDLVVTAERVQDYKPAHSHFRFFSRTTGVKPGDWVHVACSYFHDIAPARELGIHRVWLDRDQTGEDPLAASARVTAASEVPAAITQLYP